MYVTNKINLRLEDDLNHLLEFGTVVDLKQFQDCLYTVEDSGLFNIQDRVCAAEVFKFGTEED